MRNPECNSWFYSQGRPIVLKDLRQEIIALELCPMGDRVCVREIETEGEKSFLEMVSSTV